MRKFTFALLLTLLAGEAFAAASSAQLGHVFRRRIEICRAWGGCDEDGTGGGPAGGAPTISPIANQRIAKNTSAGPIAFTINDDMTPPGNLVVTVSADDGTLLPQSGIARSCVAQNCTLTLTPASDEIGQADVTVEVSDGTQTTTRTFILRVLDPTTPYVGPIADRSGNVNETIGPISFGVDDFDTDLSLLTLDAISGDEAIVASDDISFGGVGENRTITLQPQTDVRGIAQITVTATDPDGHTSIPRTFFVRIGTAPEISSIGPQQTPIDTPTSPIAFTVADDGGTAGLTVTGGAANTTLVPDGNFTIDCVGGDCTVVIIPAPGETGTTTITLTVSDGTEETPTTFTLDVIGGGTQPWISSVPAQGTPVNTTITVPFQIGDDQGTDPSHLMVYAWSNDTYFVPGVDEWGSLAPVCDVSGSCTVEIVPGADVEGMVTIGLYVEEQEEPFEWAERSFPLFILGDGPQITAIANQTTFKNHAVGPLDFSVADLPLPGNVTVTAVSTDEGIIPNAGITLGGSGISRNISLLPATDASGNVTIALTAKDLDNNEASTSFDVNVLPVEDCTPVLTVADIVADPSCGEGCEDVEIPFTLVDACGGQVGFDPGGEWGEWRQMLNNGFIRISDINGTPITSDWMDEGAFVGREFVAGKNFYDDRMFFRPVDDGSGGVVGGEGDFIMSYNNGFAEVSDTFHIKIGHPIPLSDICNIQFENMTGVEPQSYVESPPARVGGFTGTRTVTVTGDRVSGVSWGDKPAWMWNWANAGTPFEISAGQYFSISIRSSGRMEGTATATFDAGPDCTSTFTVTTKPDDPSIPDEYPPIVECTPSGWQDIFINDPCDLTCTFYDNRTPVGSLVKDVGMSWGSTNLVTSLGSCSGDTCAVNCHATNKPSGGYVEVSAVDDAGNVGMAQNGYINVTYDKNKLKGHIYVYGYSQGYFYMGSWAGVSDYHWSETNVITDYWISYALTGNAYGPEFALVSPDLEVYMINDIAPTVTALDIGGDDIGAGAPTVTKIGTTRFYHLNIPLTDSRPITGTRNYNIQVTDGSGFNRITITNPANSIPFFLTSGTQNGWGYQRNDDLVWCQDPAPDTSIYAEWREDGVVANGGWLSVKGTRDDIQEVQTLDPAHVSGMASNPMCLEVKSLNAGISQIPTNSNYYFKRFHVNRLLMPPNPPEPSITCSATNTATGDTFDITATLQSTPAPTTCMDDCDYAGYSHACLADCGPGYPSACRQDCPSDASDPAQRPYVLLRQYVPYCLLDCAPQILYYSGEVNQLLPGKVDGISPPDMTGGLSVSCPKVIANYRFNSVEQDILMFEAEVYPHSAQPVGFPVEFCNGFYGAAPCFPNPQPTGAFPVSKVLTP